MATALQQQLAAIQATRKNELDLKSQKAAHAKSLLFEPRIAAGQSFDVIYQLCREAFEDLCNLDGRFTKFSNNLFSPASKSQDRDVMTQKENDELDVLLENFLGLIGARVLLKSAQEAIEWLIRRFKIHERNLEYLVLTFLPYHAHPVFLTLLSILPSKLPPSLRFLYRYTNTFHNPPRDALVQAAIRNPSFYSAYNSYVLGVSRNGFQYPALVSLWAGLLAQSIDAQLSESKSGVGQSQQQKHEDILTKILPVMNEAFAISGAPEIGIGCHMILIVLVGKLNLDDHALDAIMSAVAMSFKEDSQDTALACLSVLAERKTSLELPKTVTKVLLRTANLELTLSRLAAEHNVRNLVFGLAASFTSRLAWNPTMEAVKFFQYVLQSQILSVDEKRDVFESVFTSISHNRADDNSMDLSLKKDIRQLHAQAESLVFRSASTNARETASATKLVHGPNTSNDKLSSDSNRYSLALDNLAEATEIDLRESGQQFQNTSFLGHSADLSFDHLASVFEAALSSKQNTDQFFALLMFSPTSSEPSLPLFTFLARFWCSNFPVESRAAALRKAAQSLDKLQNTNFDMQILIPYVLVALGDIARDVRGNAAELTTVLSRLNPQKETSPWAQATIQQKNPSASQWLSNKDSSAFIKKCLLPNLEECLTDADHVAVIMQQTFEKRNVSTTQANVLGKDQKSSLFSFLASNCLSQGSQPVRLRLLHLLNAVDNVAGSPRSQTLLPLLKDFVGRYSHHATECTSENVDLAAMTRENFRIVSTSHNGAVLYTCNVASDGSDRANEDVQLAAFNRLSSLWPRIPPKTLDAVVRVLFDAASSPSSNNLTRIQASSILRTKATPPSMLVSLIEEVLLNSDPTSQNSPSKKRRTNQGNVALADEDSQNKSFLNKLTLVLEMVESSKRKGSIDLFQATFKILQELQTRFLETSSDMAYLTSLTLNSMTNNMQALAETRESHHSALNSVRPDLLVDCVRNTSSPQNRTSALLVLSFLARQAPQIVLQSVMPIFTMMSTTTARLSDEFSAHVVDQTIQDVMPVLVQKLHQEKKDLVSATAEILLSFAAAFDHIPPHRRLQLFKLLATSLGPEESLFAIITALVDAYTGNDEVGKFANTLCREFGTSVSMATVSNILELVLQEMSASNSQATLFQKLTQANPSHASRQQTALDLLDGVSDLLGDFSFQRDLHADLNTNNSTSKILEQSLRNSFENIFKIFNQAQPAMKQKSSQLLKQLLSLFPLKSMIRSIQPLLSHPDQSICKSILGTLESRVRSTTQADKASKTAILGLLPSLTALLEDDQRAGLRPPVLACIDRICNNFGKVNTSAVLSAMETVASNNCLKSSNAQVQVMSLYCLASSLEVLQDGYIPLLKFTEETACDSLSSSLTTRNERLHNAVLAFFMALTDTIPYVVSEECLHRVIGLCQQSASSGFGEEARDSRLQLLRLFAKKLEIPLVVRLVLRVWPQAIDKGLSALQDLVDMYKTLVDTHGKSVISRNARDLFKVFLEALDLRRKAASESNALTQADLDLVEQSIIQGLLTMVLKINDTIFRPFFVQLFEWSSVALSKADTETWKCRNTTLFNLVFALSERLKSIFTPYFNYVLELASEDLQKESASTDLNKSILHALTSAFKHDSDDFWQSPSHFDPVVGALAVQFSKPTMPKLQTEAIVAFTELGAAASSNDHHKDMNARLLKLVRSNSSRTRLVAVKCQQSLTERLGDEWLSNLPEMLPSINELQEDDDEEVERETHRWIKLIEEKLGESLNSMLQ